MSAIPEDTITSKKEDIPIFGNYILPYLFGEGELANLYDTGTYGIVIYCTSCKKTK